MFYTKCLLTEKGKMIKLLSGCWRNSGSM